MMTQEQLNQQLFEAVYANDIDTIKQVIKDGADVNIKDEYGRTPLHKAALYGYTEITKMLIEKGADVNCEEDTDKVSSIHMTAWYGYFETAKVLIENKANVNAKTAHGCTPLRIANLYKSTKIAELLKQHGAS